MKCGSLLNGLIKPLTKNHFLMIGLILSKEDIGSAHLGVIKLEANNRRQYEVSSLTNIVSYICNNATCG